MRLIALDLIRFFAALSVVLYHYTAIAESNLFQNLSKVTQFGYLGVPLFFMISGYVIALSAANRSAIEFAISRIVRLYPAYWAGIFFTILIATIFGRNNFNLFQILANLTMLNDYVGQENIDGVYWTLQVELKFYICVFILIILNIFNKFRIWLTIWLGATLMHAMFAQPFFMGWFIDPSYSSFFIAGIAYYLIHKEGGNNYNYSILFISLLISSVKAFEQISGFIVDPGIHEKIIAVFFVWGFYSLFYLLVSQKLELSNRNIYMTLGGLTYPLYLIHSKAGKIIIDAFSGDLPEPLLVIMVIIGVLLISWCIHVFIEKRFSTPLKSALLNLVNKS